MATVLQTTKSNWRKQNTAIDINTFVNLPHNKWKANIPPNKQIKKRIDSYNNTALFRFATIYKLIKNKTTSNVFSVSHCV